MCMNSNYYVVDVNSLGQRVIGYDVYESKSKGFIGMSEKQVMDKLKKGERIYGFTLAKENDEDKIVLDSAFNMTNLQVKTGVNNLSWYFDESDGDINLALIVVAVLNENGRKVYETVNARHARVTYSEEKLRMMMELGIPVAGIKQEKNKIVVCEGVEVEGEVEKDKATA